MSVSFHDHFNYTRQPLLSQIRRTLPTILTTLVHNQDSQLIGLDIEIWRGSRDQQTEAPSRWVLPSDSTTYELLRLTDVWNIFSKRRRQIDLVVLLLDKDLPNLLSRGEFTEGFALSELARGNCGSSRFRSRNQTAASPLLFPRCGPASEILLAFSRDSRSAVR